MQKSKNVDPASNDEPSEEETWADDQETRHYYYDDSHGYQEFDPAEADAEDDEEEFDD